MSAWTERVSELLRSKLSASPLSSLLGGGRRPIGIDLGSCTVRVIDIVRDKEQWNVGAHLELTRPENGAPISLTEPLSRGGLAGRPAALAIADEQVESHAFKLPALQPKELASAIDWEIKKFVPAPSSVFHDVLTFDQGQGVEVDCWFAAREVVKSRFDETVQWGVRPSSLETESSALLSCARWVFPEEKWHRWVFIDLGHNAYRLIFVSQGRVSFTRSLYFGMATMESQVAQALGIAESEVAQLVRRTGPAADPQGETNETARAERMAVIERVMQESLYTLCEEFRRSEFFAKDQKGIDESVAVMLSGGGAAWPSAVEYLKRHLNEKRVELLNPLAKITPGPSGPPSEEGPAWACAVGLALREA